ncbi:hypothetical protein B0H14DRAFT_3425409 [Mycena olivaceomarginata]|nr:hypothetical protein B0H14DRAFT_3425409 [Mycena olivaceomarginata]
MLFGCSLLPTTPNINARRIHCPVASTGTPPCEFFHACKATGTVLDKAGNGWSHELLQWCKEDAGGNQLRRIQISKDLHWRKLGLKAKADHVLQDTIVATQLVDGFWKLYANAAHLKDHAEFPLKLFTCVTVQRARLAWYKSTIEEGKAQQLTMALDKDDADNDDSAVPALRAKDMTVLELGLLSGTEAHYYLEWFTVANLLYPPA